MWRNVDQNKGVVSCTWWDKYHHWQRKKKNILKIMNTDTTLPKAFGTRHQLKIKPKTKNTFESASHNSIAKIQLLLLYRRSKMTTSSSLSSRSCRFTQQMTDCQNDCNQSFANGIRILRMKNMIRMPSESTSEIKRAQKDGNANAIALDSACNCWTMIIHFATAIIKEEQLI